VLLSGVAQFGGYAFRLILQNPSSIMVLALRLRCAKRDVFSVRVYQPGLPLTDIGMPRAPWVVLRIFYHPSPYRVELYITHAAEKIAVAIDHACLESPSP